MVTTLVTQLGPGGWHDGGDAPAYWPVFPIMFGLFWLTVLGAAFYLIRRRIAGAAAAADPLARAHAVLAERFARGEIDEQEYRSRLAVLRSSGPSAKS